MPLENLESFLDEFELREKTPGFDPDKFRQDFQRGAKRTANIQPKTGSEIGNRGFLRETTEDVAAGSLELANMFMKAVRTLDPEGGNDIIRDFATGGTSAIRNFIAKHPSLAPSAVVEKGVAQWWREGLRSFIPSAGASLPGIAIGAAAGTLVGGPVGTAVGGAIGSTFGGLIFGLAEYDSVIEEAENFIVDNNLSPEEASKLRVLARSAAVKSAAVEGGFEAGANLLETLSLGLFRPLRAPIKGVIGKPIRQLFKKSAGQIAKEAAVRLPRTAAIEVGTEVSQEVLETKFRRDIGLTDISLMDAAMSVVGPSLVTTLLFFGAAGGANSLQRRGIQKALQDAGKSEGKRRQAVREISDIVRATGQPESEQLAEQILSSGDRFINEGLSIDLNTEVGVHNALGEIIKSLRIGDLDLAKTQKYEMKLAEGLRVDEGLTNQERISKTQLLQGISKINRVFEANPERLGTERKKKQQATPKNPATASDRLRNIGKAATRKGTRVETIEETEGIAKDTPENLRDIGKEASRPGGQDIKKIDREEISGLSDPQLESELKGLRKTYPTGFPELEAIQQERINQVRQEIDRRKSETTPEQKQIQISPKEIQQKQNTEEEKLRLPAEEIKTEEKPPAIEIPEEPASKKFFIQEKGGFTEVKGKKVLEDLGDFFVHRTEAGVFDVVEGKSGLIIISNNIRSEAVNDAREIIEGEGQENLGKVIQGAVAGTGLSPRFKKSEKQKAKKLEEPEVKVTPEKEPFELSDLAATPNIPIGSVESKKQTDGSFKLFFRGTKNEVFQGESFRSSREARKFFREQKAKAQDAAKKPVEPVSTKTPTTPSNIQSELEKAEKDLQEASIVLIKASTKGKAKRMAKAKVEELTKRRDELREQVKLGPPLNPVDQAKKNIPEKLTEIKTPKELEQFFTTIKEEPTPFGAPTPVLTPSMRESAITEGFELFEPQRKFITETLIKTNKNYAKDKKNLELAEQAITETATTENVDIPASEGEVVVQGGVRTLGIGITGHLANEGRIDLRGRIVRTSRDIATISQVYRNPKFETLRIFYTKDNKVVAHEGRTSRLPGMVQVFSKDINRDINEINARAKRLGADGIWLQHNHPSGNIEASQEDIGFTQMISEKITGFKGHVIINKNKYAVIEINSLKEPGVNVFDIKTDDKILKAAIPHRLLGFSIKDKSDVVNITKSLQSPKGYITVLYRGAIGNLRAIQEIPFSIAKNGDELTNYIRGRSKEFGSSEAIISLDVEANPEFSYEFENIKKLVENKTLLDSIFYKKDISYSARESMVVGMGRDPVKVFMGKPVKSFRVSEDIKEYGEIEEPELNNVEQSKKNVVGIDGNEISESEIGNVINDMNTVGSHHLKSGIKNFKEWSEAMTFDLGDGIKQYLRRVWRNVRAGGVETDEMTNLEKQGVELSGEQRKEKEMQQTLIDNIERVEKFKASKEDQVNEEIEDLLNKHLLYNEYNVLGNDGGRDNVKNTFSDMDKGDIGWLSRTTSLPWWKAKKWTEWARAVGIEIKRLETKNMLKLRFAGKVFKRSKIKGASKEDMHEFLSLKGDSLKRVSAVILEGNARRTEFTNKILKEDGVEITEMLKSTNQFDEFGGEKIKLNQSETEAYRAWQVTMKKVRRELIEANDRLLYKPYEKKKWINDLKKVVSSKINRLVPDQLTLGLGEKEEKAGLPELTANDIPNSLSPEEAREFGIAYRKVIRPKGVIEEFRKRIGELKGYVPQTREEGRVKINFVDVNGETFYSTIVKNKNKADKHILKRIEFERSRNGLVKDRDYSITVEGITKTPEFLYQQVSAIGLEKFMNKSLDRFKKLKNGDDVGAITDEDLDIIREAMGQALADELNARGFGERFLRRKIKHIGGYRIDNLKNVFTGYISGASGFITKMEAAYEHGQNLRDIDIKKTPELYEEITLYSRNMLRNLTRADLVSSRIRSMAFIWYLSAQLKSPMLNLTQNFILGIPTLGKFTTGARRKYNKSLFDVARGNLSEEDKKALRWARERGITDDQLINDIFGQTLSRAGNAMRTTLKMLSFPFSFSEIYNRKSAFLARFRAGIEKGETFDLAVEGAKKFVFDVHFLYGKLNQPIISTGGTPFSNIARTSLTFRNFTFNYLNALKYHIGEGNLMLVGRSLAYLAILGGLSSLPFLDDWLDMLERFTGISLRKNIQKELKGLGGDVLAEVGTLGLPALIGVDLSGSLRIKFPDVTDPGRLFQDSAFGVYGGLATKGLDALKAITSGEGLRAIEFGAPVAVSNPLKAIRLFKEGGITKSGRTIFTGSGKPLKISEREALTQALGFRPSRLAFESGKFRQFTNVEQFFKERRRSIFRRLLFADTKSERTKIFQAIREYNNEARKQRGVIPLIKNSTIKRVQQEKPSKRFREFTR